MYLGRYYGYYINLTPNDLRLITGLLIIGSLIASRYRTQRSEGARLRRTLRSAAAAPPQDKLPQSDAGVAPTGDRPARPQNGGAQ
jgi:hypothetical protein